MAIVKFGKSNKMSGQANDKALFEGVYAPHFIQKCAEYGVNFNSPDEVADAIQTVATVKMAAEQENSANIKQATAEIRQAFGAPEAAPPVSDYSNLATELAKNPILAKAANGLL